MKSEIKEVKYKVCKTAVGVQVLYFRLSGNRHKDDVQYVLQQEAGSKWTNDIFFILDILNFEVLYSSVDYSTLKCPVCYSTVMCRTQ